MSANYRFLLGDVLGNTILAEVPFETSSFSQVLNAPGAFSGTMALHQPAALEAVLRASIMPGRNTLFVERDGVLVWGGMIWGTTADFDADTMTLSGEGFHSYYRRRLLRADKTYTQIDQSSIAVDLINYTHNVPGGFVIAHTDVITITGVKRDRTYAAAERHWIGEKIEQLAAVDNGFNFRYFSYWDGNSPKTRFLVDYPATGRLTDFVFEVGAQLTELSVNTDATSLATHVDAVGATPELATSPLIASVSDVSRLSSMPLLDDLVSFTDVNVLATLSGHAQTALKRGAVPIVIPYASADPGLVPVLGSYTVGDIVTVRGTTGVLSLDGKFRINEFVVTTNDSGEEKVVLTFANLEVF